MIASCFWHRKDAIAENTHPDTEVMILKHVKECFIERLKFGKRERSMRNTR